MKNTIEKALQKQKEQERKTLEAEANAAVKPDDNNHSTNTVPEADAKKAAEQIKQSVNEISKTIEEPVVSQVPDTSSPATVTNPNPREDNAKWLNIDLQELEQRGFVGLETSRNLINEEYREIKRKLLQTAFGPLASTISSSNIIMVSSARPSEGKTFTAVNLALSIAAEQDKTVLLVDADVLKPNVLRTLQVEAEDGLMEYLLGKVPDLSDVIYHTNVPKLRVIPAGQSHLLSTELLASTVMKETVEEFSTRYPDRVVIIDTPPLIGINESAVLANLAGQAVIVVEEGKSKLNDTKTAVERLNPDMAIGFVVNKSTQYNETGGYYGYMYYGSEINN